MWKFPVRWLPGRQYGGLRCAIALPPESMREVSKWSENVRLAAGRWALERVDCANKVWAVRNSNLYTEASAPRPHSQEAKKSAYLKRGMLSLLDFCM